MEIPRILISGTSSRAGKTVISLGIMRALRNRGYKVQPFKIGPDYIDPSYHHFATGQKSRNIDGFMMDSQDMVEVLARGSRGRDVAVIEGTMGLYDSHNAVDPRGSTAEASKILGSPVIMVANIERISRTAAPFVLGYKLFDPEVDIAGVILNRAGNPRHAYKAKRAVEELADMRVVGLVPRDKGLTIPERHLGLVPAYERSRVDELFDSLARVVEENVDVDRLIEIARGAAPLENYRPNPLFEPREARLKLGVALDRAFTFYYQDNLDALASGGAEIVPLDTLGQKKLPRLDALYIGGGFPEVQARELEKNKGLRQDIYKFCTSNPCYGECGGLMYLGETITTREGEEYEMAGVLPLKTEMKKKFQALGYVRARANQDSLIAREGALLVGHEFHHSRVVPTEELNLAYDVHRGRGLLDGKDGVLQGKTLASYLHLHVLSYPQMVKNFLSSAFP